MAVAISQHGGLAVAGGIYNASIMVELGSKTMQINQAFYVTPQNFVQGPTLGDMAFTVQTAIDQTLAAAIPAENILFGTSIHQLQPHVVGQVPLFGQATTNSTGARPNPTASKVQGVVITKTSLISGRQGRGRMYFFPPSQADIDVDGVPKAAYLPLVNSFYVSLFGIGNVTAAAGSAVMIVVIYNRKTSNFTAQTSFRVNAKFGTQRRRGMYKVARHRKKA